MATSLANDAAKSSHSEANERETRSPRGNRIVGARAKLLLVDGWSRIECGACERSFRLVVQRYGSVGGELTRLTAREAHVVKLIASGLASKEIGLLLAIADATVRSIAKHSARKLMLRSAAQFPLLWHLLGQACIAQVAGGQQWLSFESATQQLPRFRLLSAAEQSLAVRLIAGDQNIDIAKRRMVSTQTIANQLNMLFRKLGVSSRGELAASLLATSHAS